MKGRGGVEKKEMGVFLCACVYKTMYIYEYIVIGIHIYIVITIPGKKKEFSDDQ